MGSVSRSLLARRTIKRRAAVLHNAFDGAVAAKRAARRALAIVDLEVVLEHAEVAVGLPVIAQRRTAVLDRGIEYRLDGLDQPLGVLVRRALSVGDGRCQAFGRKQRAIKRLAD